MSLYGRGIYGAGFYGTGVDTAARVKSVAVIPGSGEDEVWLIVERYIGGVWVLFLEQMQPRDYGDLENAWFVDSGLKYTGAGASTFTGLDHLEGETVAILGDGVVLDTQTVENGSVTLSAPVFKAIIGLPYRYTLKPMRFDLLTRRGTSKGSIKRFAELAISFFESAGPKYGVDSDNLFHVNPKWVAGELFTGDKVLKHEGGFDVEDSIIITGDDPLPCIVRAMIPRIHQTGR